MSQRVQLRSLQPRMAPDDEGPSALLRTEFTSECNVYSAVHIVEIFDPSLNTISVSEAGYLQLQGHFLKVSNDLP